MKKIDSTNETVRNALAAKEGVAKNAANGSVESEMKRLANNIANALRKLDLRTFVVAIGDATDNLELLLKAKDKGKAEGFTRFVSPCAVIRDCLKGMPYDAFNLRENLLWAIEAAKRIADAKAK